MHETLLQLLLTAVAGVCFWSVVFSREIKNALTATSGSDEVRRYWPDLRPFCVRVGLSMAPLMLWILLDAKRLSNMWLVVCVGVVALLGVCFALGWRYLFSCRISAAGLLFGASKVALPWSEIRAARETKVMGMSCVLVEDARGRRSLFHSSILQQEAFAANVRRYAGDACIQLLRTVQMRL